MPFEYLDRIIFNRDASVKEVLKRFNETIIHTEKRGFAIITDKNGKCIGVVSDGDIRRKLLEGISIDVTVEAVLNREFLFVNDKVVLHLKHLPLNFLKISSVSSFPVLCLYERLGEIL